MTEPGAILGPGVLESGDHGVSTPSGQGDRPWGGSEDAQWHVEDHGKVPIEKSSVETQLR